MPYFLLAIFALFFAAPALAKPLPQFDFPLACTLGTDCWVAKYVDVDPAPGAAADFTCGARTEDAHEGTDFALRTAADLQHGVDVLAARDGKVLRVRDDESDTPKTPAAFEAIKTQTRECGNGVVIDHGSGLLTFYCHLKNGSLKVTPGDAVTAGQPIAQVGQSGLAEFPHLHFAVIWEGAHIDPYTGQPKEAGCGKLSDNLWRDDLAYAPLALYDGGFTDTLPDFAQIETGLNRPDSLSAQVLEGHEPFIFWVAYFGARMGDAITLAITAPDGTIYAEREQTQEKTRTRQYYYVGKKRSEPLQPGTYTGSVTIKRGGQPDQTLTRTMQVE